MCVRFALVSLTLGCTALRATADETFEPFEPPPEWHEGVDYEIERRDSLASDEVEVGFGATGREGVRPRRSQHVRFRGDALSGSVREGSGDPLKGTLMDGRAAGGWFSVGTLAPRWGRGLVLGAAADPWSTRARDRGAQSLFRGRSGEGAHFRRSGLIEVEALGGRFAKRDMAGLRVGRSGAGLGLIASGRHARQMSMAFERDAGGLEVAVGNDRRWRAEAGVARGLGPWHMEAFVRGGHDGYRPLAEPQRAGPSQALTVVVGRSGARAHTRAMGSLWRFAPGLTGARGALELRLPLAHHGALAVGFEEQHGVRTRPTSAATLARVGRMRQGLWGEWQGGNPGLLLTIRHEAWGEERFARRAVRTVSAARIEAAAPWGVRLALAQTAYQVRRGESLYLAESEGSRTVLRALTGFGERTRVELGAPAGGGTMRAALNLTDGGPRSRAQWTLDWTRRARSGSSRSRASP